MSAQWDAHFSPSVFSRQVAGNYGNFISHRGQRPLGQVVRNDLLVVAVHAAARRTPPCTVIG